jgi:hypothetical protein
MHGSARPSLLCGRHADDFSLHHVCNRATRSSTPRRTGSSRARTKAPRPTRPFTTLLALSVRALTSRCPLGQAQSPLAASPLDTIRDDLWSCTGCCSRREALTKTLAKQGQTSLPEIRLALPSISPAPRYRSDNVVLKEYSMLTDEKRRPRSRIIFGPPRSRRARRRLDQPPSSRLHTTFISPSPSSHAPFPPCLPASSAS